MLVSTVLHPTSTPSLDSPSTAPDDSSTPELLGGVIVGCCFILVAGLVIVVTIIIVVGRRIKKKIRENGTNGQVVFNDEIRTKSLRYYRPNDPNDPNDASEDIECEAVYLDVRRDTGVHRHEAVNGRVLPSKFNQHDINEANVSREDLDKDYDSDYSEVAVMYATETESQSRQNTLDYHDVVYDDVDDTHIAVVNPELSEYENVAYDENNAGEMSNLSGYDNVCYDKNNATVNGGVLARNVHKAIKSKDNIDDELPPKAKKKPPVKKKPRRVTATSEKKDSAASPTIIAPISVYDEVKIEYGAQPDYQTEIIARDTKQSSYKINDSGMSYSQTKGQNKHYYNCRGPEQGQEVSYYNQSETKQETDEVLY